MADLATSGYTAEDLDWLRDALGVGHLELDPWGSPVVSPADDEHERIAVALARQAIEQLTHTVSVNGFPWVVPRSMELLGKANWWLPRWLDRVLPRIRVDEALTEPPAVIRSKLPV